MPRYSIGGTFYGRQDGFYHGDTRYSVGGTFYGKSQELEHFGIKGMRWGQRRYQEEDGTLTAAGRRRYDVGQALGNAARNAGNAIGGATRSAGNAIGSAYRRYAPAVERTVRGYGAAASQAINRAGENIRTTASNIDRSLNLGFGARQNLNQAQSERDNARNTLDRMTRAYQDRYDRGADAANKSSVISSELYRGRRENQARSEAANREAAKFDNSANYNDRMANQSRAEMQRASSVALSSTAKRGEQAANDFLRALNSATAYENAAAADRGAAASSRDMSNRYAANAQAYNMLINQNRFYNQDNGNYNIPYSNPDVARTSRHIENQYDKIRDLNSQVDYWEQQYGNSVLGTVHKAIDNGLNWLKKLFGR